MYDFEDFILQKYFLGIPFHLACRRKLRWSLTLEERQTLTPRRRNLRMKRTTMTMGSFMSKLTAKRMREKEKGGAVGRMTWISFWLLLDGERSNLCGLVVIWKGSCDRGKMDAFPRFIAIYIELCLTKRYSFFCNWIIEQFLENMLVKIKRKYLRKKKKIGIY